MTTKENCNVVDGTVVVECDSNLTLERYERLKADVERAFPGKPVAILGPGLHLHIAQHDSIARLEAKLDVLLDALAGGEDEDQPAHTLDGHPMGRERPEGQPL